MTSNAPAALGGDSGLSFEARLIQKLSGMHLLTTESADRALRAQARANGSLVDVLVRLGLCAERDLAPVVAEVTGCEFIKASEFPAGRQSTARLGKPTWNCRGSGRSNARLYCTRP